MSKIPIYFMPGLAAGPEIFERLVLPAEKYEFHFLEWKQPLHIDESISDYALRMTKEIIHQKPVLIGVSFGGILVQEMSKHIEVEKIILISSVKSSNELSKRFQIARASKIYKLIPTQIVTDFDDYAKFFIGKTLEKKARIYKKYLSVRDELYLKWGIHNVVNWQQKEPLKNTLHIHGDKDPVFPIKNIQNTMIIENGTHDIILTKAKKISKIIDEHLTC